MRNARNGASAETKKLQSQKMFFQMRMKFLSLPSTLESVLFQQETLFFFIENELAKLCESGNIHLSSRL